MPLDEMLNELIKREGGFSHLSQDKGGATKYGITLRTLMAWRKSTVTVQDVKDLTEDEAKAIYTDLYFNRPGIDKLPSPLNNLIFDFAVNSGPTRAIMALQEALGITVDGTLGPITYAAVAATDLHTLQNSVVRQRILMVARIVKKDPTQLTFLIGWVSRAFEFVV